MTTRRIPGRRAGRSGQAIVLVALAMVGLLAFVVLAIDGGNLYNQRRITQNAADASSLAGLRFYYANHATNAGVLGEVARVAGINTIPDPANNARAFWVDAQGNYVNATTGAVTANSANGDIQPLAELTAAQTTLYKPNNAWGIRVRIGYQFASFFGTVIGQSNMAVQADGVSIQQLVVLPNSDTHVPHPEQITVALGGGSCTSGTTMVLGNAANDNNFNLAGIAYINGSLANGTGNNNFGLYKCVSDNCSTDAQAFFTGTVPPVDVTNHVTTGQPWPWGTQTFPDWAYYPPDPAAPTRHLIQAQDFRPTTDSTVTDNYIYRDFLKDAAAGNIAADYIHNVAGTSTASTAADTNGALLRDAMMADGATPGIYFVDGPVRVDFTWPAHMGLVATGVVEFNGGSASTGVGYADDPRGWGKGLSILAGAKPDLTTTPPQSNCAVSGLAPTDPAFFRTWFSDSQQASYDGILYSPNGPVDFNKNFNNGHGLGPVVSNSLMTGVTDNTNNINFTPNPSAWLNPPLYVYNLQQ